MDSDEEDFGPTVPPLSVYIQGILNRYPDGGQILKELLQNAEDAGASVVKFMYDKSTYDSNNLFLTNLQDCQGPALCAYNDAEFQECDWKGIQEPQRSHKSDSVLKVGKFGIGFNSVYHVTDIPWLLSGRMLVLMEPSEKLLNGNLRNQVKRRSGFHWNLNNTTHQQEIKGHWEQFVPVDKAACAIQAQNQSFSTRWQFQGTLFRLPFRPKASKMASTVYSDQKIQKSFNEFAVDGAGLLLFLLKVENIELLHMMDNHPAQRQYSVRIASVDSDRVKQEKNNFSKKIINIAESRKKDEKIQQSLENNMHFAIDEVHNGEFKSNQWIVSHFVPNESDAPTAWSLESSVKRLPWVSVAAQVETPNSPKINQTSLGGLFCFLPLPRNSDLVTGLPIHINAYFGISDNRRNLKWPDEDQTRDVDAQWNTALRDEVIPHAYVQLVCYCRDTFDVASYSLWPEMSKVHGRWKLLVDQFYKLLFKRDVLKLSCNGNWTSLNNNIYIDNLKKTCQPDVADAVRYWLNAVLTSYVTAPENVIAGIEYYSSQKNVNYITPAIVRKELNEKCRNWNIGDLEKHVLLLEYFVTKSAIPYDFQLVKNQILNLPLIPLLDGHFGAIYHPQTNKVMYLVSQRHQTFLRSMQNSTIRDEALSEQIVTFLTQISGLKYGVEKIDARNFPTILKSALPDSWKGQKNFNCNLNANTFPDEKWLYDLWKLIRDDYPNDLSLFVGLTILECGQQNGLTNLVALPNQDRSVIFVTGSFSPNLEQLLIAADAIPVPDKVMQQHVALAKYIHVGKINNLIKLLQNCDEEKLKVAINENAAARKELVAFLAKFKHEMPPDGRNILRKLPLFEILLWPSNANKIPAVSIEYCCSKWQSVLAVNFEGLPLHMQVAVPLLDCRKDEYSRLADWLEIKHATKTELANGIINEWNVYDAKSFSLLMLWCMDHVQAWDVKNILKESKFVSSDDGDFHAPKSLIDPNVDELKTFFSEESGKFPSAEYALPRALEFLRGLGLRTSSNDITSDEIMQTAKKIDELGFGATSKRDCFIQILKTHCNKLSTQQMTQMKSLKLFCAKRNAPKDFPSNLPWFGVENKRKCYSAVDLGQEECGFVVGSVMPVLGITLPQVLINGLGFIGIDDIEINLAVSQLKIVSENFHKMQVSNPNFQSIVYKIYKTLSKFSDVQTTLDAQEVDECVWAGNKFLPPIQVVAKWTHYGAGLEPYLYSLPDFLQEESLETLFYSMGVLEDDGPNLGRRVLQEIKNKHEIGPVTEDDSKRDFNYVRSILEILSDNLEENEDVEIPIKKNAVSLTFLPASKCKFNDSGAYDILEGYEDDDDDDDSEIILVHNDLPSDLCKKLNVPLLSSAVLEAEVFEQREDIVQRLKNIIAEYPAGDTIFQELIQNADDAKATEIGFLLDMRENGQWRRSVLWKASGMEKFQGPALWVFNDAVFSNDDFTNILSLGGATKCSQSEKIGTFGVGFNSVYNVTDIPSFVSRNYLVFFDPQKLCIPNTTGIKFDLMKKTNKLKHFSDQFSPYKDVFGCDLSYQHQGASYPNTLFRLPLRDDEMAEKSKLCNRTYNMKRLLQNFAETRNYVMLFLQHVETLNVRYLSSGGGSPQNAPTVLSIRKVMQLIHPNVEPQETFTNAVKRSINENLFVSLHRCSLVTMNITNNNNSENFMPIMENFGLSWIVQWSATAGEAYQLAATSENEDAGLMPAVAMAVCVKDVDNNKRKIETITGNLFCYLPLPIASGLPFHVHAPFALSSNRRHLWTESNKDESTLKTLWNEALKKDALVECFIELLQAIKRFDEADQLLDYQFDSLWPRHCQVKSDFSAFVTGVYDKLLTTNENLWKTQDGRWVGFSQAHFLMLSPHWSKDFVEKARKVLQISLGIHKPTDGLVLLSPEVQSTVEMLFRDQLSSRSYTDETFFETIFFPNLHHYEADLANFILLEILKGNNGQKSFMKKLLQENCCIPSSPNGDKRLAPRDLVDPQSEIHQLYDEKDEKFPYNLFRDPEIRNKLISLGMRTSPTGEMLVDRAKTIQGLVDNEEAKCRSNLILKNLADIGEADDSWYKCFLDIPFMVSLQRPANWPLPWYDDGDIICTPKELTYKSHQNLICFVSRIWDDKGLAPDKKLRLNYHLNLNSAPGVESDTTQLEILEQVNLTNFSKPQFDLAQRVATDCLKLLGKSSSPVLLDRIMAMKTIFIKPVGAVSYNVVCSQQLEANYAPYLFSIKDSAYEECLDLLHTCEVRKSFTINDYIDALKKIQKDYGADRLSNPALQIALSFCTKISNLVKSSPNEEYNREELLLPDINGVLTLASDLTFWELRVDEIPDELMTDANFCNRNIPRDAALSLGVQLQRTMVLEKFSNPFFEDEDGEAYGQYEDLTTRIKNILTEYSNKSDVISEMIQNADDAKATEIHFILDERQLPTNPKTLLSDNWQDLQGPALIVYNNKPFREKDFDGLQKLGLGSKRDDPELTGKYGIGFNTVYNLTDVPMFVSNGEKLCILDPHRSYLPNTRVTKPGKLYTMTEHFKTIWSDVLLGFKPPVANLDFAQSTVFRLPLRKLKSKIGEPISVEETKNMLNQFKKNAKDFLMFLRNVEKIQITFIDAKKNVANDVVYYCEMSDEDRQKKIDFFQSIYNNEQLNDDAMVQYNLRLYDPFKRDCEEWLVLQRMSCMKNAVPDILTKMMTKKTLIASPMVGIATCSSSYNKISKVYTTLPLPGNVALPVHINAKFILDSGRKHIYLHNDGSDNYKTEWNTYLIVNVLAPLYVQALESLKENLGANWNNTKNKELQEALARKYQIYFPVAANVGQIELLLLKQVYQLIHAGNLKLLFGVILSKDSTRQLLWLSISEGILDFLDEEFGATILKPVKKLDCIESILEKVNFPKFHQGFHNVMKQLSVDLKFASKSITPGLVAEHMKKVDDDVLILPPNIQKQKHVENAQKFMLPLVRTDAQNLPTELRNTVLYEDEMRYCLSYILTDKKIDLNKIPLLLTADDIVRRLSSNYELYQSQFSHLLPSQGQFFCSSKLKVDSTLPETFCQKFTVSSIAKHINVELPHLENVEKLEIDQIENLIWQILTFLSNFDYPRLDHEASFQLYLIQYIRPLENWALLPVSITNAQNQEKNYLVSLKNAPLAVYHTTWSNSQVLGVLRKLGCMFTNVDKIIQSTVSTFGTVSTYGAVSTFFNNLCVTTDDSTKVVNLLYAVCNNEIQDAAINRINEVEKLILLEYIISKYSLSEQNLNAKWSDINKIKSLPLFQTMEGNSTTLNDPFQTYISCDGEIEGAELDKLMSLEKIVFLKSKLSNKAEFCKSMSIKVLRPADVYKDYIIPCLEKFNMKSVIKHMKWIKTKWIYDKKLCEQLGSKPLIEATLGRLKAVNGFYDEKIRRTFGSMMSKEEFIPQSFWTVVEEECGSRDLNSWKSFFEKLGLKTKIGSERFLELAIQLEENKSMDETILEKDSKLLVNYLMTERELYKNAELLNNLSTVKFVFAHNVGDGLNQLYKQDIQLTGLVCFRNSIVENQERVCWSVCKLLPSWSTKFIGKAAKHLGYCKSPKIHHVVTHVENIYQKLQPQKYVEMKRENINSDEAIGSLREVTKALFNFFDQNIDEFDENLLAKMKNVPCVLVEGGRKLVCPNQVATDSFDECPPFLYILPEEMFPFIKVLQKFGTERKVVCQHYISALKMLHSMFSDAPIQNPNMKNSLKNVYVGFLNQLIQMGPEKVNEEILYLPDENSCLQKSTEILVFTENPRDLVTMAIPGKKWNTLMIQNIDIPLIKCADALMRLPLIIRPTSFKQFVNEILNEDCEICTEEFCEHSYNIKRMFQNPLFVNVMIKLIKAFGMHLEGSPPKPDEFAASFKQVRVQCYKELKMTRYMRETNESLGEAIIPTFWRKTEDNESEFLVMHDASEIKESFADNLLSMLKLLCPMRAGLHESFCCAILEKLNLITQTESLKNISRRHLEEYDVKENYLPQLGSLVNEDLIALFNRDSCYHYEPFDYVVCPVNVNDEENMVYIFGRIVKEVEKSQSSRFLRWFLVDIGEAEPEERSTLYIYKFISVDEMEVDMKNAMPMQPFQFQDENQSSMKFSQNVEEMFEEVSEQLETYWKLTGADKKTAIKRMYLYWHPDKNPRVQTDYCTEVFKHLLNEIERMEKGIQRKSKGKKKHKGEFFGNEYFTQWDNQAQREKTRRQDYYERAAGSNSWDQFSSSTRESGVPPAFAKSCNLIAKLWYKQAKCDLDLALREAESENPCYEWVFYKHYQVARKCMIAMLLTRSTCENQNANLMELALDVSAAFGAERGDICNVIRFMIRNGVDEVRTINPRFGKTPHDNYQQSHDCVQQVGVRAKELVKMAESAVEN
uniref:Sacsin/Nov domain-containing protein n=1 Tax=Strigamia maritima TaxID=126957 RepID=T1J5W4_STRMM